MGTKFAPTYATLVLGYLEEKLYQEVENTYNQEFAWYIRNNWKIFLDDCFIIWTKSKHELIRFHSLLNNLHADIKFTIKFDEKQLPFLDVQVIKQNGKIITDIFYKETDSKQYLKNMYQ